MEISRVEISMKFGPGNFTKVPLKDNHVFKLIPFIKKQNAGYVRRAREEEAEVYEAVQKRAYAEFSLFWNRHRDCVFTASD